MGAYFITTPYSGGYTVLSPDTVVVMPTGSITYDGIALTAGGVTSVLGSIVGTIAGIFIDHLYNAASPWHIYIGTTGAVDVTTSLNNSIYDAAVDILVAASSTAFVENHGSITANGALSIGVRSNTGEPFTTMARSRVKVMELSRLTLRPLTNGRSGITAFYQVVFMLFRVKAKATVCLMPEP